MSKLRFIDLFCGIGGFRIAFEKNGGECVLSSDIDKYANETYELNFGEKPMGDVSKIGKEQIPDFEVLCAGFPCQPFSIAGKRKGFEDTRGTLFFEVARILKEKQPKAFLLENVKGLVNHDKGNTLKTIMNTLDELDYDATWDVINAMEVGVPQNRERWYCVGFRRDLNVDVGTFAFPHTKVVDLNLNTIIKKNVDLSYSISDTCKGHIDKFIAIKQLRVRKTTLAYEIRPSRCQFANDGHSPCLTAKMGTGGNNIPVVVEQYRRLTEKECLQIMGFPKEYKIAKNHHSYKQIGNSVVVPVITELAKELVSKL